MSNNYSTVVYGGNIIRFYCFKARYDAFEVQFFSFIFLVNAAQIFLKCDNSLVGLYLYVHIVLWILKREVQ